MDEETDNGWHLSEEDRSSFEAAKMATVGLSSEKDVLEHLCKNTPPFLRCSFVDEMDKDKVKESFKGLADKIEIHGYPERAKRLRNLHQVLTNKLEGKKADVLSSVLKLLVCMSERPTGIVRMTISEDVYSNLPDEEIVADEDVELKNEILRDIFSNDNEDPITLSYSSGSELSDWSSDEEESEKSKKSNNEIVSPEGNLKPSLSFSEFSDLPVEKDIDEKKREMELYWSIEGIKAQNYFSQNTNQTTLIPLQCQPVISGLLALHSKFGEFWEWKKLSVVKEQKLIISEQNIIREILCQMSILNAKKSPVFSWNWSLKPELMLSTVSAASLSSSMEVFEKCLAALSDLKTFVRSVENSTSDPLSGPSKVILCYTQGLSEFSHYVATMASEIDRNLNLRNEINLAGSQQPQPCTTIIQLHRQLPIMATVLAVFRIHTLIFPSTGKGVYVYESSTEDRSSSIVLVSMLSAALNLQTNPTTYGVLLFIFSKCLHAFLDEINFAIMTMKWDKSRCLYLRGKDVKLSDPDFWTNSITVHEYLEELQKLNVPSMESINNLIPDVLVVLKTCEMLAQLEEDSKRIIGNPPPAKATIEMFLKEVISFPTQNTPKESDSTATSEQNYLSLFRSIGVEGKLVQDSMRSILFKDKAVSKSEHCNYSDFKNFITLHEIPMINPWEILGSVISRAYDPLVEKAKNCIKTIFEENKVNESMKLFREIILGIQVDFAKAIVHIASKPALSSHYKYEDGLNRNPEFQKLLMECYPEGRDNFEIDFITGRFEDSNYQLVVRPRFPLNLVLTPQSLDGYLFVSRQLGKIRKSLWEISALRMKDYKRIDDLHPNRVFLFRFALIHFCSSFRAYLVLKIFAKEQKVSSSANSYDLDLMRKAHESNMREIETQILRCPVIQQVIIRKMVIMSETVSSLWLKGIPLQSLVMLEDTLKKCWTVVNTFGRSNYSTDFNELSYHFAPAPICLYEIAETFKSLTV